MSKYKNIEQLLKDGRYNLKVLPANEWDNDRREFVSGSHKSGTSKNGFKWWMYTVMEYAPEGGEYQELKYNVEGKDYRVSVFASEKNKRFFDEGELEMEITPKLDEKGNEILVKDKETGEIETIKKLYFNQLGVGKKIDEATAAAKAKLYEDEVDEANIPF